MEMIMMRKSQLTKHKFKMVMRKSLFVLYLMNYINLDLRGDIYVYKYDKLGR